MNSTKVGQGPKALLSQVRISPMSVPHAHTRHPRAGRQGVCVCVCVCVSLPSPTQKYMLLYLIQL